MGRAEREVVAEAGELVRVAGRVVEDHERAVGAVREAWEPLHRELVGGELARIPVARLRDVTEGRLRLGELERDGFRTVGDVLDAGVYRLRRTSGVGQVTAEQAVAAARNIADAVAETVVVRIDVDRPEPRTTALVKALRVPVEAGTSARRGVEVARELRRRAEGLLGDAAPAIKSVRMLFAGAEGRRRAREAVGGLRDFLAEAGRDGVPELLAQTSVDLLRGHDGDPEGLAAWVDFEHRSAEYYALLTEISGRGPEPSAAEGFLPDEIAGQVRGQRLDERHLRVSLRRYQAFGARFALARKRVLLGDEMGLGKTVQAVAALAHLAAEGHTHFFVVCPASVLINWIREIESRSALRTVPLHGPGRQEAFADWRERGGVAVTTFESLRGFPAPGEAGFDASGTGTADSGATGTGTADYGATGTGTTDSSAPGTAGSGAAHSGAVTPGAAGSAPGEPPAILVVDEAHYVTNPQARRTAAVRAWAEPCERVLFLTGTPMENRVAEFRSLVRMLRPDLREVVGHEHIALGSTRFRRAVAPVYLRRNQRDVLSELPELQHTDEWEEPGAADLAAYREAVEAGNFMAMRRAAYARPEHSAKLARLRELVREPAENGLKVVVFSAFRSVLATVEEALTTEAAGQAPLFGPLDGGVPPVRRQRIVDDFSRAGGHAVLLAQIEAGGVGLNLQAASVVILCEPQMKPTVEQQAVARAHRMGQVRTVQVHRLLGTGGVDERLVALLADKTRLFDAYARRSSVAESDPDAVDPSDAALARRVVEEEQARLAAVPVIS